jgi:L-fuconolactonase
VIDAHVHCWDPALGYAWLRGRGRPLERRYDLDDYRAAGGAAGVVVVEANDPDGDEPERQLAWEHSEIVAVIVRLELADPDAATRLAAWSVAPRFRGVRGSRRPAAGPYVEAELAVARRLGEAGCVVEVLAGAAELVALAPLAEAMRGGHLVIDHLGDPPARDSADWPTWRDGMSRLADTEAAAVKVSAVLSAEARVGRDAVEHAVAHVRDRFGDDRVPAGSDWPICLPTGTLRDSLDRAAELAPESERAAAAIYAV